MNPRFLTKYSLY